MPLTLTKHEALGNDFLVLFDDQPLPDTTWDRLAVRLCDRRRGIGADGLLVGFLEPAGEGIDLVMGLWNADGSRAEMSGNGIRCLAQAYAARSGVTEGTLRIHTDAGLRTVEVLPGSGGPGTILASVAMGEVTDLDAPAAWEAVGADPLRPVRHLSLGNPHTVVAVDDVRAVDLLAIGTAVPEVNLEIVEAGPEPDAITMRVHERGAGITEACGTGACAAAWAAGHWGLVAPGTTEITVHMDGGDAKVRLGIEVTLVGPATHIATIEVP
jgi:diaminopimelate epimerase